MGNHRGLPLLYNFRGLKEDVMEYFTIELCEILLDLTALFVCIFIVLFIIISAFKNKRKISGTDQQAQTDKQTDNFNEAVMAQLIKEQLDKSLADVVGAINDEKLSNNKIVKEKVNQEEVVQKNVEEEQIDQNQNDEKFLNTKGSLNNKLAILSVEAPVWQGVKTQEYQDILSFRNAVRRDASALKMSSYCCASPNIEQEPEKAVQVEVVKEEEEINDEIIKEKIVKEEIVKEEEVNDEIIQEAIVKEPEFIESDEDNPVESEKIEVSDKYDEAADLAKSGMNVYEIADKIKLPMGEIEMIVNLNRLRDEVRAA